MDLTTPLDAPLGVVPVRYDSIAKEVDDRDGLTVP